MMIGLVACSKSKLDHAAPARELYTGTLFKYASQYAERECDRWYILSAEHGLVHPDTVIEPYDLSLYWLSSPEYIAWGENVRAQLTMVRDRSCVITWMVLAGAVYHDPIVGGVFDVVELPLAGMGIGQQIAWLKEQLGG